MLQWLSPTSSRNTYDEKCREHLPGTGAWLLVHEMYNRWRSNTASDLLRVTGTLGCGKSVLAARTVIDLELFAGHEAAVAYTFCQRLDEATQSPAAVLGSLARQIIDQQDEFDQVLMSEYEKGESPSLRTILRVLNSAIERSKQIFLVVDGLNECQSNSELTQELVELVMSKRHNIPVKIIIFSRLDITLEKSLEPYNKIRVDDGANTEDLKAYVDSLFPNTDQSKDNAEIRRRCIEKAQGMFQWVRLFHQSVKKLLYSRQILRRIEKTLPGLESVYDRIFEDMWNQGEEAWNTASLVLMWITHARRPLTLSEMMEAVAEYSTAKVIQDVEKVVNPELLVAACMNLVYIDEEGYFRPCHESVLEYLSKPATDTNQYLARYQQQSAKAHKHLAEICLKYLLLENFTRGPARSKGTLLRLMRIYPFLDYAARFWGWHVSGQNETVLCDLVMKVVLSPPRRELSLQIAIWNRFRGEYSDWKCTGASNALHLLSIFGLTQIAKGLPNIAELAKGKNNFGTTPLIYALERRHHKMSLWLVEQFRAPDGAITLPESHKVAAAGIAALLGWIDLLELLIAADGGIVDCHDELTGHTPLHRACLAGEENAAKKLIENHANVNAQDTDGATPLHIAVFCNNTTLVELLLLNNADPDRADFEGLTPLYWTTQADNADIAKVLLQNSASANVCTNSDEKSPMHVAAEHGAVEVIELLHYQGSDLNAKAKQGITPLQTAAFHNSVKSAQTLLELGAAKDEVDEEGQTALHNAAQTGASETVNLLVDRGCDVTVATSEGLTAVHIAADSGKLNVLRSILKGQPRQYWPRLVNQRDGDGLTPLHYAVISGNARLVKFLLDAGADPTVQDNLKCGSLHYAAHFCHKSIARLLLEHTQEVNICDREGETPLHLAARLSSSGFIKQFFQDCAQLDIFVDLDVQNDNGETAFHIAVGNGSQKIAQYLMSKKIFSRCDRFGDYPIHAAAWHGFVPIVEVLLNYDGATKKGRFGRTPLHCAAARGHLQTVRLLAKPGDANLNIADHTGRTPLQKALGYGYLEVANFLLDIGADCHSTDDKGIGMLHTAAMVGDLAILRRLLRLGCKGDKRTDFDRTPFYCAVAAGHINVVDALIEAGFDGTNLTDSMGNSCAMVAASRGDLAMLKKLSLRGAQFGSQNLFGSTTVLKAAAGGHRDVLEFLKDRGEQLDHVDCDRTTALIFASMNGYPETVKYLLENLPQTVNVCDLDRCTALTEAVWSGHLSIVDCLLAAGANPCHRSFLGLSAWDSAALQHSMLERMRRAIPFQGLDTTGMEQKRIIHETIRRCCTSLLQLPQGPHVGKYASRISRLLVLSRALLFLQDYEAVKSIYMELLWPPKARVPMIGPHCSICRTNIDTDDKYSCPRCELWTLLCTRCHDDYLNAGKTAPNGLKEVLLLEKTVQPVRLTLSDCLTLGRAHCVLNHFTASESWISSMLDKYKTWEQEYNRSCKYANLERPGQAFLKLMEKMATLFEDTGTDDAESAKSCAMLNTEYGKLQRRHRPDKVPVDFRCEKHDYLLTTAAEQKKVMSDGIILDPETGMVKPAFFQSILEKYSQGSSSADGESGSINPHSDSESPRGPPQHPESTKSPTNCATSSEELRPAGDSQREDDNNNRNQENPGQKSPMVMRGVGADLDPDQNHSARLEAAWETVRAMRPLRCRRGCDAENHDEGTDLRIPALKVAEIISPGFVLNYVETRQEMRELRKEEQRLGIQREQEQDEYWEEDEDEEDSEGDESEASDKTDHEDEDEDEDDD